MNFKQPLFTCSAPLSLYYLRGFSVLAVLMPTRQMENPNFISECQKSLFVRGDTMSMINKVF